MTIIEIGRNSLCIKLPCNGTLCNEEELRSVARKAFFEAGKSFDEAFEISAYSNGQSVLMFVCEKETRRKNIFFSGYCKC